MNEIDLKIVFFGPSSVGKTSLIARYTQNTFKPGVQATVGAGFLAHTLEQNPTTNGVDDNLNNGDNVHHENVRYPSKVTLMIWDTSGEERFRSVAPCLLHGAQGIILVFALNDKYSFDNLQPYYNMFLDTVQVEPNEDGEIPVLLVGNKVDLFDESAQEEGTDGAHTHREVTPEMIKEWMEKNGVTMYADVSAKTGFGIREAVEQQLVKCILKGYLKAKQEDKIVIQMPTQVQQKKGCC